MADAPSWIDRRLLHALQKLAAPVPVRLGTQSTADPDTNGTPLYPELHLKNKRVLRALALNPEMAFGDAYSKGDIEISGDLLRLLELLYNRPLSRTARLTARWLDWVQNNTLDGSRRNIHHHYDIPTDFYKLWLDEDLVYTCAYFPQPDASLEQAQRSKLDLVCRKIWLRPGETVVEAGCGWGALALHMAKNYGVRVRAFNVSHEQIAFARDRARREGLANQVEFVEDDYRNVSGQYDAFVSLGMLEHVGKAHYPDLSAVIARTIGRSGRGLLHFIGRDKPRPFSVWIRRRVFPGAYAPSLREALEVLEPRQYSVLDVENLRAHYARTLEHWLERFEQSYDKVADTFGSVFARMWRLYLAGSVVAFRVGTLQLFQIVFAGAECNQRPWNREHLYTRTSRRDEEWIHAMS